MHSNLEAATLYGMMGWRVIPLVPNGKNPILKNWPVEASCDPDVIESWFTDRPDLNVGIVCGEKSGIVCYDIDVRHGGDAAWEDWLTTNGGEPLTGEYCLQETASKGRHFIAKWEPGIVTCKLIPGIDLLSDGAQFVAYPSKIDGKTYQWQDDCNPFEGTVPMQLSSRWVDASINTSVKNKEILKGGKILEGDRNAGLTQLAGYLRSVGMSEAEIFAAISVTNETRCNPPLAISSVKTIAHSVARYEPNSDLADSAAFGSAAVDNLLSKPSDYYLTRATGFLAQPAPIPWAIKGWLPENGTTMLFGESGIGKTFIAIDMACHMAAGMQWAGIKTKPGVVVYLAGEGNWGLRQRVAAWCKYYGVENLDNLLISNKAIDLDNAAAAADVLRVIVDMVQNPEEVVCTFIDTLNRHMSGDENSAKDVRGLLNACGVVSTATNGATIIIHHTGHGEQTKNRERGSSALRGAMDSSLQVLRSDEGIITLKCKKMKDAKEPGDLTFRIQDVDLGWVDEDGEPEAHAGVVVMAEAEEPETAYTNLRTDIQSAGFQAYESAALVKGILTSDGKFGGLRDSDWRDSFYAHPLIQSKSNETKKKNYQRVKKDLIERGEISEMSGIFFLTEYFSGINYIRFANSLQAIHSNGTNGTGGTNGTNVPNVPFDKDI